MTAVTKPLAQSPGLQLLPFVTLAPTADGKLPGTTESPLLLGFLAAGRQVDKKASIEDESIARTVDSTDTSLMMATTAPLASAQMKAAAPQTQESGRAAGGDTTAPTVSLTTPTAGATVSGTVNLTANASDNKGVTKVEFWDGANLIAADTSSTGGWGVSWNTATATNGAHTLRARAYDAAGNQTTSAPVSVTVANDTTAPTVSLTGPAAGGTVSGMVNLGAAASDNVGVAGVQFRVDGVNVGAEATSSPYSLSWDSAAVGNGGHTITAVARDAAGNTTTSAAVTVTVANAVGTTTSINVGSDPNGVAVVGNRAYVANGASDTVSVIDVNTQQTLATIPVGHTPTYVVAKPDGERVYVSNRDSNSVSIISTATNWVTHTIAVGSKPPGCGRQRRRLPPVCEQ